MRPKIHGVLVALVTPMTARQEIDLDRLAAFTDHLIRQGVHGLIPLGSTGEFYALTAQERQEVLKTVIETSGGRVAVLAGANAGSTREVVRLSQEAEKAGADGVLLAPPYYSLPRPDELLAHFQAVNDAIDIPIMLYNYPGRTGVDLAPEFIERLAALRNVRYVKESTGEMSRITTLLRTCGDRLGVFCGCDTIALESLAVGALGWVGGVSNALPRAHVRLYDLVAKRESWKAAHALFFKMLPTLELMEGRGKYTQFVKAACALAGQPVGPPRQPLAPPTAEERALLRKALSRLDESRPDTESAKV